MRHFIILFLVLLIHPALVFAQSGDPLGISKPEDHPQLDHLLLAAQSGDAKAVASLQSKAETGDSVAQYNLWVFFMDGIGVKEDDAKALNWLHQAANNGNMNAQGVLGDLYMQGDMLKQDYAEAAKWFHKAADQGNRGAQEDLMEMYEKGEGVKQDWGEAYFWRLLDAKREEATYTPHQIAGLRQFMRIDSYDDVLAAAKKHLTPKQVEGVKERVEEWVRAHP